MVKIFSIAFLFSPAALFAGGSKAAPSPAAAPPQAPPPQEEKVEAYFFYEELCSLCQTDYDRFISILQEQLPLDERDQYPHNFYMLNVHDTAGRAVYVKITDELGVDRGDLQVPLLILGGRVFQGYDSISSNVREAYLTTAEDLYVNKRPYSPKTKKAGANLFDDYPVNPDHVTLVYFYRIVCPYCEKVRPLIDALPEKVTAGGKEKTLDIIRINTRSGNNGERIAAFFEAWQVPDEDRQVPIVFFSGSYLSGDEAIAAQIARRLSEEPGPWKLLPEKP